MDYLLIFILEFIGIGLSVMQVVKRLDDKFEDDTLEEVFMMFLNKDRSTLIISGFVLLFNLVAHYILVKYTAFDELPNFQVICFGISFVLGYAGQRILYKYLGSAERFLNKKVNDKLQ